MKVPKQTIGPVRSSDKVEQTLSGQGDKEKTGSQKERYYTKTGSCNMQEAGN